MTHQRGLYDSLLTTSLAAAIQEISPDVADLSDLSGDDAASRMVEVFSQQLARLLDSLPGDPGESLYAQLALINTLIRELRDRHSSTSSSFDEICAPPKVLHAIRSGAYSQPAPPVTGLTFPWLFTSSKGSPSLLNELRREAAACDHIDILVSFITVSGVRKILDVLEQVTAGDAHGVGRTTVRVLTTTYIGATEVAALDQLARLNGVRIKISLDARRTRLHAKAWMFNRRTGFGSAYVGSANLSASALMGGLEWTVKFTERGQSSLYARARAHFDTLWEDDEFQPYHPDSPEMRAAVIRALREERGERTEARPTYFDLQPKHYQREMLAQLHREREFGRRRSLIVAATGTGKTVVAAFDYRDLARELGYRPRLLFVAHRRRILLQALATYRAVLRDNSFGEVLSGGVTPAQHDFLFASIDSLASRDLVDRLGVDYWNTVVIDECHRIAAPRFDKLASSIRPHILLGLTATPERTDGRSILPYFDQRPDGGPAVELRLWDALDLQLLTPFEYFAADDETDFSDVPWDSPGELAAVSAKVSGNETRARLVVTEWHRLTAAPRRSRALAFCVSVEHAQFMAAAFNSSGLPAACVLGETPERDRLRLVRQLEEGKLCVLVTVDLFNEGVDLPSVDTLLLLRPTQSALLFQQQIGRGLRLSPGKDSCLILDFVGHQRVDFRFDRLLSTLSGLTRRELIDEVEHGFSSLPSGCHIHLQRQTRTQVLQSLRGLANRGWQLLRNELQSYAALRQRDEVHLAAFIHDQGVPLTDIYRHSQPRGWTPLRRSAGLVAGEAGTDEATLSGRYRDLLHIDDPEYLRVVRQVAESGSAYVPRNDTDRIRAHMLGYQIDTSKDPRARSAICDRLGENQLCAEELAELAAILASRASPRFELVPGLENEPLSLHGSYRIREILTAFGYFTETRRPAFREGVLPLLERKLELLFVTIDKREGISARIAYKDYAISPTLFHWQSQNSAGTNTAAGRRYINSPGNGWRFQLFVRKHEDAPYRVCGPVTLADEEPINGDRPLTIRWMLQVPLPPNLFGQFSVLRS